MLSREPNSARGLIEVYEAGRFRLSTRSSHQIGGRKFLEWEGSKTPPDHGLTPPVCQRNEIGRPIDGEGPTEPPVGYGLTHRSILPESQFRTGTRFIF
jgi:hypothetical protein